MNGNGNEKLVSIYTLSQMNRLCMNIIARKDDRNHGVIYSSEKYWACMAGKEKLIDGKTLCTSEFCGPSCSSYKAGMWTPEECLYINNITFSMGAMAKLIAEKLLRRKRRLGIDNEFDSVVHGFLGEQALMTYWNPYCMGYDGIEFDTIFGNYPTEIKTYNSSFAKVVYSGKNPTNTLGLHIQVVHNHMSSVPIQDKKFTYIVFMAINAEKVNEISILGFLHKNDFLKYRVWVPEKTVIAGISQQFNNWGTPLFKINPISELAKILETERRRNDKIDLKTLPKSKEKINYQEAFNP